MENLKEYYERFTCEELEIMENKNKEFNKLVGLGEALIIVEKNLGKVHKTTIEIRKAYNNQLNIFQDIVFNDEMMVKIMKDI